MIEFDLWPMVPVSREILCYAAKCRPDWASEPLRAQAWHTPYARAFADQTAKENRFGSRVLL